MRARTEYHDEFGPVKCAECGEVKDAQSEFYATGTGERNRRCRSCVQGKGPASAKLSGIEYLAFELVLECRTAPHDSAERMGQLVASLDLLFRERGM